MKSYSLISKARTDNYDVDILESIMRAYQVKESRDLIGKSCVVMALEHSDTVIYFRPICKVKVKEMSR